jgi:hypothetical protein
MMSYGFTRWLPIVSALVITAAGAAICAQALVPSGMPAVPASWLSGASVLGLGLVLGLKHALDADHVAAVSTIVSERRGMRSSSLVGMLWGVGHTLSLLVAGVAVILLHVEISARLASAFELGVALMLIGLGANALRTLMRGGSVHLHAHEHGRHVHIHPHLHDGSPEPGPHTHHGARPGTRPLMIGIVHGLAGSAALMLLVLSTIPSPFLGFAYIGVFGIGSIGGMMVMSALLSLPVQLSATRFARADVVMRTLAGCFSIGWGVSMAYEIGVGSGLFL